MLRNTGCIKGHSYLPHPKGELQSFIHDHMSFCWAGCRPEICLITCYSFHSSNITSTPNPTCCNCGQRLLEVHSVWLTSSSFCSREGRQPSLNDPHSFPVLHHGKRFRLQFHGCNGSQNDVTWNFFFFKQRGLSHCPPLPLPFLVNFPPKSSHSHL